MQHDLCSERELFRCHGNGGRTTKSTQKYYKADKVRRNRGGGGEDRISALPDCVLVEIVSRLDCIKDAIRTGTLSNRWKHIWTSVPVLIFTDLDYKRPWSDFVSSVDKTLTQCRQLNLKKFELYTGYGTRSQINSWIRYAIRCNVEELHLRLWNPEDGAEFRLDQFFFINSSFTDLTLEGCMLKPSGAITWKNLRSLWITEGNLDKDLIENIFSGSPLLETLVLNCYPDVGRLDITSKSVKKLVLSGYLEPKSYGYEGPDYIVEINAPNILSLAIKGHLVLWNFLLLSVSSLIEADLDYTNTSDWKRTRREEMLKRFILNPSHVKELKIGRSCSKDLSRLKAKGFVVPSNMKFPGATYIIIGPRVRVRVRVRVILLKTEIDDALNS